MPQDTIQKPVSNECPLYKYAREDPPICGAGSDVSGGVCTDEDLLKCEHITCYWCLSAKTCKYAFDPYNTHSDCLMEK